MKRRKQDALTRGANGAPCLVNVAAGDWPERCLDPHQRGHPTTVAAHLSWREGLNGVGWKVDNLVTVHACRVCHDALDARGHPPMPEAVAWYYMGRALARTTLYREQVLGLITVNR